MLLHQLGLAVHQTLRNAVSVLSMNELLAHFVQKSFHSAISSCFLHRTHSLLRFLFNFLSLGGISRLRHGPVPNILLDLVFAEILGQWCGLVSRVLLGIRGQVVGELLGVKPVFQEEFFAGEFLLRDVHVVVLHLSTSRRALFLI